MSPSCLWYNITLSYEGENCARKKIRTILFEQDGRKTNDKDIGHLKINEPEIHKLPGNTITKHGWQWK